MRYHTRELAYRGLRKFLVSSYDMQFISRVELYDFGKCVHSRSRIHS